MTFKPGDKKPKNSGKKKGSQHKVTQDIKEMIRAALDEVNPLGGKAYLIEQAKKNPNAFLTLIGKIIPSDVNAKISGHLTLQELVLKSYQKDKELK